MRLAVCALLRVVGPAHERACSPGKSWFAELGVCSLAFLKMMLMRPDPPFWPSELEILARMHVLFVVFARMGDPLVLQFQDLPKD